jgi:pimeloyl-ACP methyl ester carboxylesterase
MTITRNRAIALGIVTVLLSLTLAACGSSQAAPAAPGAPGAPGGPASVVSAPVRIARTTAGRVGYRVVGSGAPLVMIMGYGATMEVWDPRFVDALARHYRVVIFDNAGIGQTQALATPLTIDEMADQTSALIDALGLGRTDVLGWSMGGMIAQALAVRHPAQVRRLVLCATFPGTGAAVVPPPAGVQALTDGHAQPYLFPADQAAAYDAFVAAISGYPAASAVPASVIEAQGAASLEWFAGRDPAGRQAAAISVPALIADGTADRIDAVRNDYALAKLIPDARLVLYPDAGHAFLFQDETPFTSLIESFLGGAPSS